MRTTFTLTVIATIVWLFVVGGEPERGDHPGAPERAAAVECVSMERFVAENPGATPEDIHDVDLCLRTRAEATGASTRNSRFLSNTADRPAGALAHYKGHSTGSSFTVFDGYIETTENFGSDETQVPFERVTKIEEGWQTPGTLLIDYVNERGRPGQLSFMLLSGDDGVKGEGARDVDRLRELLETQRSQHASNRS